MSDKAPAFRDPAMHFDALRLVTPCEGGRIEDTLAKENERGMLIRAPAHVHPVRAFSLLLEKACSPLPARSVNWLDGPCLAS